MEDYSVRWRERYAKVLKDYPELKEASNLSRIYVYAGQDEKKLQQMITAALICDDPYCYSERDIMDYSLAICNTPSEHNFISNSPVSYGLMVIDDLRRSASNPCRSPFYKTVVGRLEQIYFTL